MDANTKRYLRQFVYSMIAYVLTLIPSILLVNSFAEMPLNPAILVAALTPVVPVIFMLIFFVRYLSQIDELQKRIQLLAIGLAAGITGLVTFTYGFLEVIGLPHLPLIWVFPILIFSWGIGTGIFSWKYK